MKTTMLEYSKIILRKVCFDRKLFKKEFKKTLQWLSEQESKALKDWLRLNRMLPVIYRNTLTK